jgi:hypothetical protein
MEPDRSERLANPEHCDGHAARLNTGSGGERLDSALGASEV